MTDDIHSIITAYIKKSFLVGFDASILADDTSFLEKGIVDSTGIMELVSFVEEQFGFKVKDEELIPENLDSINNLVRFVQHKTGRSH